MSFLLELMAFYFTLQVEKEEIVSTHLGEGLLLKGGFKPFPREEQSDTWPATSQVLFSCLCRGHYFLRLCCGVSP